MDKIDLSIGQRKIEAARRKEKLQESRTPQIVSKALKILGFYNDKLAHIGDQGKIVDNLEKRLTVLEREVIILRNRLDQHTEYDLLSSQQTSQRTMRNHGL